MNEDLDIFNKRSALNAEMSQLMSNLSANTSPIGDWKVIKISEARMQGLDDPYDFEELVAARKAARERIDEIRKELEELSKEDK